MMSEASILVVDDHPTVRRALKFTLEGAGYRVLQAGNGQEALVILAHTPVSLILADIAMPGMNGYQLYERVRENPAWVSIPFIFLTARTMDSDIRYGKEMGADDYLTKPAHPEDLLASVHGKLRRAEQLTHTPPRPGPADARLTAVVAGRLTVDCSQHRAWLGDEELTLSALEFLLLDYLARHAHQVVTTQELVAVTHGLDAGAADVGSMMRPLIRSLRRKLGYLSGETGCIENVRGVGYRLEPPAGD
jgi:DNA-binding response OmpR family regulator